MCNDEEREESVNKMTEEQAGRFMEFVLSSDLDYYEDELMFLPIKEQLKFFADNPQFMEDYPVTKDEQGIMMLRKRSFRETLRYIHKKQNEEKENN
ncbi:MAG: hypothetical protein LUG99_22780 [Lachnospiraceae bacterium]|nr:hypothetical protein [Lachnospiraceae bacterium]